MVKPSIVIGRHSSPFGQSEGWLQSCSPPGHELAQVPFADGGIPMLMVPQQIWPPPQLSEPVHAMVPPVQRDPIGSHDCVGGSPIWVQQI